MADLNASSLKDLKRFFLEYYHPGNAALCLSGDFDPAPAKRWISEFFGPLAPGTAPDRPKPQAAPPHAARLVQADRVSLPRVYWAWPTVADDHPDSAALDLLAHILTDGDASRLERALVREARVAKEVSANSDTKEIDGLFTIEATAAEGKPLKDVEAALAKEVDRLKAEPPTQAELTRALAKFEKRAYSRLTSPQGRAFVLAIGFAEKDDPAYYRRDIARYFTVTPADLARVAARYLTPEKVVLDVVPMKPGEPKAKAVQAGPLPSAEAVAEIAERSPVKGPDWAKMPGAADSGEFQPPTIIRKTLRNGAKVLIVPWRTLPIVTGRWLMPVGTADDPAAKVGLAELTSTLLLKGTKDKTDTELAEALEGLGVSYGCSADLDDTTLSFNVLARNLEPALALLAPIYAGPRLDPADFERERDLQLAGLTQGPDSVNWLAQRAFRALLYTTSHPYGRPGDGYVATVKAISLDDVKRFHDQHFYANESTLVIVGDVDPDALVATLERTVGRWDREAPKIGLPKGEFIVDDLKLLASKPVAYLVDKPGAVQSVLRVGRTWTGRKDPRYYAAQVGNHVFGVDFLSRLNRNLREKNGYTYGAGSTFSYRRNGSVWLANSAVNADVTAPALKEMLAELDGIAGPHQLTPDEIELGRDALMRSFPQSFEDPDSIAGAIEPIVVFGLADDYLAGYLAHVRGTPADEVRKVLADLARKNDRTILVVGDRKALEPGLKALGLEVRPIDAEGKPVAR
jgi:predicted Zn-dependent peptidase